MEPPPIVEADVVEESGPEMGVLLERHPEEPLGLQGMEERLHVGVIVHLPRAIHALDEAPAG